MDDHARRMMNRFVDAVADFDEGRITLLDLSRLAGQTAGTIDNASAPLPSLLVSAENDLEFTHFAVELEQQAAAVGRILEPILAALGD